jgi:hypothetical protein
VLCCVCFAVLCCAVLYVPTYHSLSSFDAVTPARPPASTARLPPPLLLASLPLLLCLCFNCYAILLSSCISFLPSLPPSFLPKSCSQFLHSTTTTTSTSLFFFYLCTIFILCIPPPSALTGIPIRQPLQQINHCCPSTLPSASNRFGLYSAHRQSRLCSQTAYGLTKPLTLRPSTVPTNFTIQQTLSLHLDGCSGKLKLIDSYKNSQL